jgi:hypothetical protein
MQRVTHSTKSSNLFGTGKDGYSDGVPSVTPATILNSAAQNHIQEEIARAIEGCNIQLSSSRYDQLRTAQRYTQSRTGIRQWQTVNVNTGSQVVAGTGCGASRTGVAASLYDATDTRATYAAAMQAIVVCDTSGYTSVMRLTDADTESWTTVGAASSYTGSWKGVTYDPYHGLAIAWGTGGEIQTMDHTVTGWVRRKTGGSQVSSLAVRPDTGQCIAADSSGTLWTALTGSGAAGTWTSVATMFGTSLHTAVYGNGIWAVCDNTHITHQAYGSEVVSWTQTPAPYVYAHDLGFSAELGLFFCPCGEKLFTSPDCVTWTQLGATSSDAHAYDYVCVVPGGVLIMPDAADLPGWSTADGVTLRPESTMTHNSSGTAIWSMGTPDGGWSVAHVPSGTTSGRIRQSNRWAY